MKPSSDVLSYNIRQIYITVLIKKNWHTWKFSKCTFGMNLKHKYDFRLGNAFQSPFLSLGSTGKMEQLHELNDHD